MKQTVTETMFRDTFRAIRPDNFSYAALGELFDWFEDYEDATGEEMELDVIAICCDWSEYTLEELKQDYGYMLTGEDDTPTTIEGWAEFLDDHTMVIEVDGYDVMTDTHRQSLIVQAF